MIIQCVVERITYQNPENGYTVLKVSIQNQRELVTLVGNLCDVGIGSILICDCDWKNDSKYGKQLIVHKWEEKLPATAYGIQRYLGSGLIKGLGKVYAKKIVDMFGLDTIEIIEKTPERLLEVPGLGKKKMQAIVEGWSSQKEIKNVMIFLQGYDVSTAYATKIYKTYGNQSIEIVKENPYRLADDIMGIGFKTADQIALKMGFEKNSYMRLRSGMIYTLSALADEGHVYSEKEQLVETAKTLLECDEEPLMIVLENMLTGNDLVLEDDAIYLPSLYHCEMGASNKLKMLKSTILPIKRKDPISIEEIEKINGVNYDDNQILAIDEALRSKVLIITGGPGTGKTTTISGIITAFKSQDLRILLAAPTGRAAKRMTEATHMTAKTIHRMLEYNVQEGFGRNDKNPLDGDVLIVDESSMMDIVLLNSLVKAIPIHMKVIFVGDIDQLPSVGPGNCLRDIIDSNEFPVIRLTKIFRQAQQSTIITNAHRINEGDFPDISNHKGTDFFFIEEQEADKAAETIVDLVSNRLPTHYKVDPKNVQVLTPMQKGVIGTINLNSILQEKLNPQGVTLRRGMYSFRVNDKVMQIKNDYDKNVFNGDIGIIKSINTEDCELVITFDERDVTYDFSDLDEIVEAYAITIHKSQGSEYPVVVMPIMMSHYIMLQRNLLYTGITRAKKLLVLVGSKKAIGYCVRNVVVSKRNTKLKDRLRGEL